MQAGEHAKIGRQTALAGWADCAKIPNSAKLIDEMQAHKTAANNALIDIADQSTGGLALVEAG